MKKRILNVGCGKDTYGTDFVDLYPLHKKVIVCDLQKNKLPYNDNIFDEVYSAFVIEHMKNPGSFLKELKRVLKKNGTLVIKTDNAGFWAFHNSRSKAKVHYGGYNSHGEKDIHFMLYTTEHLKNYFEDLNLQISELSYFKGHTGKAVNIISDLINKTRFNYMAYPHILIKGIKKD